MGAKKERVPISGQFWDYARVGHMVIIMMIYILEVQSDGLWTEFGTKGFYLA